MDEHEDIFGSPDVLFNILKRLKIDDNVTIADFTFENSGMSFRKTLESIKIFVTSFINMVINTKNLYKGTEFDPSRPFNEENELTYSKICEINKLEENNSIKRKIDEEEISRPYKKIRSNTTWKKLKINKKPRNIRKCKINDSYKNNHDNKDKDINKWEYVIADFSSK
ncbi:hypothetical protein H8356DRAFT_1293752 [Neocallimastix lanati (nom. inval.)]|nr:hypothetical protein H8356DRAFT_1293752 [Neocallimastix sp. JGI-2020a]